MQAKLTDKKVASLKAPADGHQEVWDTVLSGFGVRVSAKGRRSFICKTRVSGRQRRHTIGTYPAVSLADARDKARAIFNNAERGVDHREQIEAERRANEQRRRDTFGAVADEFIADHAKPRLRTWQAMQQCLVRDVLPSWSDRPITEITRRDVKDLLRRKAESSPSSATKVLEVVRRLFNWALDEEIVQTNPALRIAAPGPKTERARVLTDAEIALFWRAAGRIEWPFGPLYRIAALTAQRRGEVAAMRWHDLDLKAGAWTLPAAAAKSGVGHLVPLSAPAVAILSDLPRLGDLVFSDASAPPSGFSKAKRRLDRLMLEIADADDLTRHSAFVIHDIRRTAATNMRELGHDRLTISKVLNHREAGVTRIYDRFAMDPEKRAALDAWSSRIESLVTAYSSPAQTTRPPSESSR